MDLLLTVLTNTFAKNSLQHRLKLLREFLEFKYFTPHKNDNLIFLLNEFFINRQESRDEFNALNAWGYDFYNQFSRENFYQKLNEINQVSQTLPEVAVYLPVELPIYDIPKLGTWFRTNVNDRAIIDIKFDRTLIGGCALAFGGNYQDFSLRYYLEKNKEAVRKLIEDFLSLKSQRINQAKG